MSSTRVDRRLALLALLAMLTVVTALPSIIEADEAPGTATAPAAEDNRDTPRGRLPDYYIRVVGLDQRDVIYGIQQKYQGRIDELLRQVAELEAQRDKEVEGTLTPEQLARVKQLQQEAEARRAARQNGQVPSIDAGR